MKGTMQGNTTPYPPPPAPLSRSNSDGNNPLDPNGSRRPSLTRIGRQNSGVRLISVNSEDAEFGDGRHAENLAHPKPVMYQRSSPMSQPDVGGLMPRQQVLARHSVYTMWPRSVSTPPRQGAIWLPQPSGNTALAPTTVAASSAPWMMAAEQPQRNQASQGSWREQVWASGNPAEAQPPPQHQLPQHALDPSTHPLSETSEHMGTPRPHKKEQPPRTKKRQDSSGHNSHPTDAVAKVKSSRSPSMSQRRRFSRRPRMVKPLLNREARAELSLAQRLMNFFVRPAKQHRRTSSLGDRSNEEKGNILWKNFSRAPSLSTFRDHDCDYSDQDRDRHRPCSTSTDQGRGREPSTRVDEVPETDDRHDENLKMLDKVLHQRQKKMRRGSISRTTSFRGNLGSNSDDDVDDEGGNASSFPLRYPSTYSISCAVYEYSPGSDPMSPQGSDLKDQDADIIDRNTANPSALSGTAQSDYSGSAGSGDTDNSSENLLPCPLDTGCNSTLGATSSFFLHGSPDFQDTRRISFTMEQPLPPQDLDTYAIRNQVAWPQRRGFSAPNRDFSTGTSPQFNLPLDYRWNGLGSHPADAVVSMCLSQTEIPAATHVINPTGPISITAPPLTQWVPLAHRESSLLGMPAMGHGRRFSMPAGGAQFQRHAS